MQGLYYAILDVHKKTVSACAKHPDAMRRDKGQPTDHPIRQK